MSKTHETTVKIDGGSSGIVALAITFFFGPLGAFFSYWLIAKRPLINSLLLTVMWFILIVISALLCMVVIGFILLPIVWILMLVFVYKAADNKELTILKTSVTETDTTTDNK